VEEEDQTKNEEEKDTLAVQFIAYILHCQRRCRLLYFNPSDYIFTMYFALYSIIRGSSKILLYF
jgi:hypothetical protein